MNDDYNQRMNQARLEVAQAKRNFLNIYFDQLKELYVTRGPEIEAYLPRRLEELIRELSEGDVLHQGFNSALAIKTRIEQGYETQKALAEAIGVSQQAISRFERGESIPSGIKEIESKNLLNYLQWLKEKSNGYNPYHI